jgi:formylglycine-generating enzyme required for sulfatase activity
MGNAYSTFGIRRTGSSGNFSYSVTGSNPQAANMPIFYESWADAARFCNWLQNGQGTATTVAGAYALTESGAYAINGTDAYNSVPSPSHSGSSAVKFFLPTEDESYKAAYYKSGGTNAGYWAYPTKSNTPPINTLPDTGNHANFDDTLGTGNHGYTDPVNFLTPVGAFNLSPGPYGTFDQGGDVYEWNETFFGDGSGRGTMGGSDYNPSIYMSSGQAGLATEPYNSYADLGFRVASSITVPEPGTLALLGAAGIALLWRGRRRLTSSRGG